jgi:cytochrome c oxidase assembly factor CtaG
MSLLGFLVSTADRVLYPHYVLSAGSVAKALADQRLAGTIMWETSMVAGVVALSLVLAAWMRYEDVETRRVEMLRSQRTDAIEVRGG